MTITKLPDELEKEFPPELQMLREFYFSLSDKERKKLDSKAAPENKTAENKTKHIKFCFECGKRINRSAKYCEFCGVSQPEIGIS